ncbi:MAG: glutamine-hydrolyzing carbamoyl-phosphate synthase small subunit [Planctomycetes bacterium]|nr:glutamine-hydrolyzing carbamoyl-phosphate synthase small subunit [Planctomycetota bacterium]
MSDEKEGIVKAVLLLEDGTQFDGRAFGARGQRCGEVVFNTSMAGYQEILTDPSYHEQIVTMTYPLIGNYGTNPEDWESRKLCVAGFVVKENCTCPSNWRNGATLDDYLQNSGVVGIEGIDTRRLVRHIRTEGAMRGIISSIETDPKKLADTLAEYPGLVGRDLVKDVTVDEAYEWQEGVVDVLNPNRTPPVGWVGFPIAIHRDWGPGLPHHQRIGGASPTLRETAAPLAKYKVVAFDFGIKHNILRLLVSHGCQVTVVPARTTAAEVLARQPDGVFLSNGPGDPAAVTCAIDTVKALLGQVPIFGICLGHQILGLALGGRTYKLKFGHRGANHPVKNLDTGKIEITSQNHGFCVDLDSLRHLDVEMTHLNLNDHTCEGIRAEKQRAFSVQYHPEAAPGPHDSQYLFDQFVAMME